MTRKAARIGWRGRQRNPIRAPASAPAPYEAVTTPNTAVELYVSSATVGPST